VRYRFKASLLWREMFCALVALANVALGAQPLEPLAVARSLEANLLLLEVRLDGFVLTDTLYAYQDGSEVLLPLGELARLLTLAIRVQAKEGRADGFVVTEERAFGLNLAQALVGYDGREVRFEPRQARVMDEDIYVVSSALSQWLPIDFKFDIKSLQLQVQPRVTLPVQARLARERSAMRLKRPNRTPDDPGYPRLLAPNEGLSRPFIDQTLGADARFGSGSQQFHSAYTAYLTADVLGLEGAAYFNAKQGQKDPDYRWTLARNEPEGTLLGALRAKSFTLGSIQVPTVVNVMGISPTGLGAMVSNRPLDQPSTFDRQSLRGDLPPGWDVTLYFNEALVGFQQSRGDGLYAFDDLALSYGRNDFELVFNGPLGQMRTERKSFTLDQSALKPSEFLYSLAQHQADNGESRSFAKFDIGLSKQLTGSATLIRLPRPAGPTSTATSDFGQLGLRAYWDGAIVSSSWTSAARGGGLGDLALATRLGNYALDVSHTQVRGDFDSDYFSVNGNPVRRRDKLRLSGTLALKGWARFPLALEAQREQFRSGARNDVVAGRLSFMLANTYITNGMSWQTSTGAGTSPASSLNGNLQLSRRLLDMGLSGQLGYTLRPAAELQTLALSADRNLANGYRVNAGVLHNLSGVGGSLVSLGLSRNFGPFALAVSGSYSSRHELVAAVQIFFALGHNPQSRKWFSEPLPLAGTGAVFARAFVDKNLNGAYDVGEELIPNAGFVINQGGRHPSVTDEQGTALLMRLPPGRYADIALDASTLEDPQWKTLTEGLRVLPRPGAVQKLDFPVVQTSDIDGTVFVTDSIGKRAIGDVQLELVNQMQEVVMRTNSSADGFYTMSQVLPGRYILRVSKVQASKFSLTQSVRSIEISPESDFISGVDVEVFMKK
jgi:hypothetical protein